MASFRPGILGKTAALAAIYIVVAKLGLMLDAVGGFATLVWMPSGVALAALLLYGNRLAPAVFVGALVVNVWTGAPVPVAIAIALGNTLEALLGAHALRNLTGFQGAFDRLRHVIGLVALAAALSTLVSATVGVASLTVGGVVPVNEIWRTWQAWWMGDMLGVLVVAPVILTWATLTDLKIAPLRAIEAIALGGALVGASLAVFFTPSRGPLHAFESPYVLFPLFIWAALRFELRGAATATAVASAIAIWGTVRGAGPFVRETLAQSLLALQTFMACAAFTPLVVAGALSDRARAIRIRESFVTSVSHDLKNPLSAIQMSASALVRALPASPGGRVEAHEQLVRRAVDRMSRLIGDLLDAAAIDAGRMSLDPREEDAGALVTEAVDLLRPLAAAKRQQVEVTVHDELHVKCDHARVIQVLSNLLGNAIKFSDAGRTIVVRVAQSGVDARISVEDQGSGIEPGHLRHVFERFWHASRDAGGESGLGLFLAKGIVEAHGGTLWAESRVGVGSTFHFTLPRSPGSAGQKPLASHDGGLVAQ